MRKYFRVGWSFRLNWNMAGWSCMTPFRRISCNRFLPFVHVCSFRNRHRHHQVLKHVNKKMKCLTECSFPERNSFLMLYSLISDFPVNRYIVTSGGTRKKRYCRVNLYTVDCKAVTIRAWNIYWVRHFIEMEFV